MPRLIKREGNGVQSPTYHDGQGNRCTRRLVFSRRSSLTHEQLEERKKKGELKKLMTEAEKQGYSLVPNTSKKEEVDNPKQDAEQEKESVQDHQTDTSSSDKTFDLPDIPAARLDSKGEFKQTFEFNKQIGCEAESVNTINSNMVPPSGQGNPTVNKEGISSTYEEEMDETPLMQLPPPLAECLGNQSQKRNRKGAGKGKRQAVNTASPQPESDDSAIRSDYGESGDAVEQPVKSETKRSKGSNRGKGKDQESSSTKAEASGDP